eukprot:gnl/TRDRNA2_/TRDRNA2_170056_c0_seq1.p2 gnl/TRDRNA2_/TRDRNA2_170056_c0~~gnl/TRDRNA2_/TRDRNA2_170056_c0_seq1.p2  ORF type:complete len:140 (-),score=20.06 gnl/TRDRNA2_/TRDRNA2_170056_c0_seq1:26-445(-)
MDATSRRKQMEMQARQEHFEDFFAPLNIPSKEEQVLHQTWQANHAATNMVLKPAVRIPTVRVDDQEKALVGEQCHHPSYLFQTPQSQAVQNTRQDLHRDVSAPDKAESKHGQQIDGAVPSQSSQCTPVGLELVLVRRVL